MDHLQLQEVQEALGGMLANNYGANDAWLLIVDENGALEYETILVAQILILETM